MSIKNPARILRFEPGENRRILAVSDIHGNLPYFRSLLEKAGFSKEDELIIVGDFLEKGPCSLETLRFVMELCRQGNVHALCGNCDDWDTLFLPGAPADEDVVRYIKWRKNSLLWDMCKELGLEAEDYPRSKELIRRHFAPELDFLASLPHVIETENFIFAHGGIRPDLALEQQEAGQIQRFDDFMNQGFRFDKWVIVGHWPVMLYGTDRVCANPVIDRESRIISIDGGCVLKDDGQLNALVIPQRDSRDFDFIAYDPFPEMTVLDAQDESESSYYIRWGDNRVQVLRRGEEFSRCRHVRTGWEMDILTKYLYSEEEITSCNDCTDYRPRLLPGDRVSVVERCSDKWFIKHKGVSGWYSGRLE